MLGTQCRKRQNKTKQNPHFLFTAIIAFTSVITIPFFTLEPCVTPTWPWLCLYVLEVLKDLFYDVPYTFRWWGEKGVVSLSIKICWNNRGPMRWCHRSEFHFIREHLSWLQAFCIRSPLTLTPLASLPKRAVLGSTCGALMGPATSLLAPLPALWMSRREEGSPTAGVQWKNRYNINENNKERWRRFSSRTAPRGIGK